MRRKLLTVPVLAASAILLAGTAGAAAAFDPDDVQPQVIGGHAAVPLEPPAATLPYEPGQIGSGLPGLGG